MNKKNIDIILPWRIGDALLNIPMLVCLKQLNEQTNSNYRIRILTQPFLSKLFKATDIFDCKPLSLARRAISHFNPSDKAFFVETTSKNFGYYAKKTYGLSNPCKKRLKFDVEMPFLNLDNLNENLPSKLVSFLRDEKKLSLYTVSLFGVCLELGYSVDQIIETFDFKLDSVSLEKFSKPVKAVCQDKYVVFCMEAAYGRKGDAFRRWDENNFFEIAHRCNKDLSLKSVFVGLDTSVKLPDKDYLIDKRKKLNLFQLAQLLKLSECYIGNDTGPLHIANLVQKRSIGVYFREKSLTDFSPLFPELNVQIFKPEGPEDVLTLVTDLLSKPVK